MELNLTGKTAIVTGGSAGIGLACATALFAEGVSVLIVGRNPQRLEQAAEVITAAVAGDKDRVLPIVADLTDAGDVQRVETGAIKRLGRIDILINCAGSARAGAFFELSDQDFLDAWKLKLLGYIRMVRAVVPHMAARKDGRIVNIIGAAGRTPPATFLAGSTTNAALINFTRGISKELARDNIRINAISPGSTVTERSKRLVRQTAAAKGISVDEVMAETVGSIPTGRLVEPSEVADLALFLVSDRAASITGAEILLDGGRTPGM
ncbi:MAG: short-chain dehydrogenase [Deltaproteobacteria bacterium SG8_13]|nr:MAG: short-chain dehydrogenase [Deltaproteobacteria bacterium SG8_13]